MTGALLLWHVQTGTAHEVPYDYQWKRNRNATAYLTTGTSLDRQLLPRRRLGFWWTEGELGCRLPIPYLDKTTTNNCLAIIPRFTPTIRFLLFALVLTAYGRTGLVGRYLVVWPLVRIDAVG